MVLNAGALTRRSFILVLHVCRGKLRDIFSSIRVGLSVDFKSKHDSQNPGGSKG